MTAHGDISTAVRAMKAGAVDFIEKPFDDQALLTAIGAALEKVGAPGIQSTAAAAYARIAALSSREREVLDLLIAGKPLDMNDVLIEISRQILRVWSKRQEHPFAALLAEYDRYHTLTGRRLSIIDNDTTITGQCEGLDSAGRLLVRGKTLHRIIAGQVEAM